MNQREVVKWDDWTERKDLLFEKTKKKETEVTSNKEDGCSMTTKRAQRRT